MPHRDALVESQDDASQLVRFADEKLQEMADLHDAYEEETTDKDDPNRVLITLKAQEMQDRFRSLMSELGTKLEKELQQILKELQRNLSRPEERRKFVLMRNKLKGLTIPFLGNPYSDDLYDTGEVYISTDPKKYVDPTLEALWYLEKYWHRIERYQEIQHEIPHGPFTILNEYGYRPGEYDKELGYFDDAAVRVGKMGFNELLYGRVILTTRRALGKNLIGQYWPRGDFIKLAVDWVDRAKDQREKPVPVFIHEFGHRLWNKFLPDKAKTDYVASYGWVSGEMLSDLWQHLLGNNFSLKRAKKGLPPILTMELDWRWKRAVREAKTSYGVSMQELRQLMMGTHPNFNIKPESILKVLQVAFYTQHWSSEKVEPPAYVKPRLPIDVVSVTWYGKKSPEEDFCEAFMYYCMGWKMEPVFEERLVKALSASDQ